MDAHAIFSLRLAPASKPSVQRSSWFSRRVLESIAIQMSLISQAIGFSGIGIMIIVKRPQADLNGFSGGSSIAVIGGGSALLVGAVFLVAAFLHWRFCARRTGGLRSGANQAWIAALLRERIVQKINQQVVRSLLM
jgi:hypothetical protein